MAALTFFRRYSEGIIPSRATHLVRAFYGDSVEHPSLRGAMAFQTWHVGKNSVSFEIRAAYRRPEISRVEFLEIGKSGWTVADRPAAK